MKSSASPQPTALWPLLWVSASFGAGVLLNIDRVPLWVPVAAALFVAWRLAVASRPIRSVRLPGTALRSVLALLLVGAVLARFRTLNGLNAGTALLVLMGASKLLETRSRRDELIVVGAAMFLLLAACLASQDLLRVPFYLAQVWLSCSAIAVVSYAPDVRGSPAKATGFGGRSALLLAGRTLLLALPLALMLFLFFPRLPGAFWALPRSEAATTGLSDTMSPGAITELTSSYDIAFRARFDGPAPPPQERYWRGLVLHDFDGYTWRRNFDSFFRQRRLEYLGPAYRYRISLEPSSQRWWFALDTPNAKPDAKVYFTSDYELIGALPVVEVTTYTAVSYTTVRSTAELSRFERQRDTAWHADRNTRSKALSLELRARAATDGAFVTSVLEFLRTGGFEYTLAPPRLGRNSVDEFLFTTRSGFCEHFASAFVALMRAGGVPAHVVAGYLGGEWNPSGGYFTVRQSDAHAWAEVWLEGRGWTRVDPTAVVEPERLTRGILDLLPNAVSAPVRILRGSAWLTAMMQRWDATNAWWNDHFVKFDFNAQLDILQQFGVDAPDLKHLGWLFAAGLTGWLLWIAWQVGKDAPSPRPDRLARAYSRLCRKLAKAGIVRAPHQGPRAYADAVTAGRPELAEAVCVLLEQYAQLRFGESARDPASREVTSFEQGVARLRIRSAP